MADTQKWVWVKTSALDKAVIGRVRRKSSRALPFFPPNIDLDDTNDDNNLENGGHVDWGWARGTISQSADNVILVQDEDSVHNRNGIRLPPDSMEKGDIVMDNSYENENYPDDLITLTHLHEPTILHCLRRRYAKDKIYTSTGPILIAVNPFKDCYFFYSESVMKRYWKKGEHGIFESFTNSLDEKKSEDKQLDNYLPPHIFGIADNSYRSMMVMIEESSSSTNCNQSIIVSGESGSGKTVTTRFVMQYLATLSRRRVSHLLVRPTMKRRVSSRGVSVDVEQQVLKSNPILESFGNARTIRNDNSSRFGKFIQINFTRSGSISGASIETYLLEKVRLISQADGERNYHVFYEMLNGMDAKMLETYFLTDKTADDFKMINNSGTFDRRDGVDDGSMFHDLLEAIDIIGFSPKEEANIFAVASSILHASNLSFNALSDDESEIDISNAHVQPFLSLMGIKAEALNSSMCYFSIQAGKETHTRSLPRNKCEKGLEAFIKATYGALFTYIVKKINTSIAMDGKSSNTASEQSPSIGVLDIFGFESFEINSLEQLCINYCNETLQQQFNTFILKNEQVEYEQEGIAWSFISFPDNQDVLDLIDGKRSSIISLLSDQCRAPGTTDKSFANAMYNTCSGHSRFQANHRQVGSMKFAVNHYAGLVEYDIEGFVAKNRDELPKGATDLLRSSTNKFINGLADIISPFSFKAALGGSPRRGGRLANSSIKKPTVGETFSRQLRNLRQKIANTTPHYVRCLKPNDDLVPDQFDPVTVLDQLRSGGVVEAVRVSRAGYPQRYTHEAFIARYGALASKQSSNVTSAQNEVKSVDVVVRDVVSQILNRFESPDTETMRNLDSTDIQIGKTKVFLRQQAFDVLEGLLIQKKRKSAIVIQANIRRYIAKRSFFSVCWVILFLQCCTRRRIAIVRAKSIRQQKSIIIIQRTYRQKAAHHFFTSVLLIAQWTQRIQRGRIGRAEYNELRRKSKAILLIQCFARQCKAKSDLRSRRKEARDVQAIAEERDGFREETQRLKKELEEALHKSTKHDNIENREVVDNSSALSLSRAKNEEELLQENSSLRGELDAARSLLKEESEKANEANKRAADLSKELDSLRSKFNDAEEEIEKYKRKEAKDQPLSSSIAAKNKSIEKSHSSHGGTCDDHLRSRSLSETDRLPRSRSRKAALYLIILASSILFGFCIYGGENQQHMKTQMVKRIKSLFGFVEGENGIHSDIRSQSSQGNCDCEQNKSNVPKEGTNRAEVDCLGKGNVAKEDRLKLEQKLKIREVAEKDCLQRVDLMIASKQRLEEELKASKNAEEARIVRNKEQRDRLEQELVASKRALKECLTRESAGKQTDKHLERLLVSVEKVEKEHTTREKADKDTRERLEQELRDLSHAKEECLALVKTENQATERLEQSILSREKSEKECLAREAVAMEALAELEQELIATTKIGKECLEREDAEKADRERLKQNLRAKEKAEEDCISREKSMNEIKELLEQEMITRGKLEKERLEWVNLEKERRLQMEQEFKGSEEIRKKCLVRESVMLETNERLEQLIHSKEQAEKECINRESAVRKAKEQLEQDLKEREKIEEDRISSANAEKKQLEQELTASAKVTEACFARERAEKELREKMEQEAEIGRNLGKGHLIRVSEVESRVHIDSRPISCFVPLIYLILPRCHKMAGTNPVFDLEKLVDSIVV